MILSRLGLTIAFLTTLSACSSTQSPKPVKVVVQTKVEYITIPFELIQSCQVDKNKAAVGDNTGLLYYASYLESLIDTCNETINSIKQWAIDNG